jgi:hypothetical protein
MDAEKVAEANLSDVVCNKLVILQVRVGNLCRSWSYGHVRLAVS